MDVVNKIKACPPARRPFRSDVPKTPSSSQSATLVEITNQDTGLPMSNPKVELHIAGYGVITLELDEDKAPKTVANFLEYVNKGHYDNTIFHRVIPGFMVQGGGFEPGMKPEADRCAESRTKPTTA